MGAGAAKRVSAVRWGVAGNMVVAWVLTIPAAAGIGAGIYGITRIFGENSTAGPVVVAAFLVVGTALVFGRRLRRGSAITAAEA
jgi:PiT family inorganic phosphate transporter